MKDWLPKPVSVKGKDADMVRSVMDLQRETARVFANVRDNFSARFPVTSTSADIEAPPNSTIEVLSSASPVRIWFPVPVDGDEIRIVRTSGTYSISAMSRVPDSFIGSTTISGAVGMYRFIASNRKWIRCL